VECLFCLLIDNWLTPIRQGQLVCVNEQCWEITLWRTMDAEVSDEANAIVEARGIIRDAHTERLRDNMH
jgi:hypothetical protein